LLGRTLGSLGTADDHAVNAGKSFISLEKE
jgi:hypothetical protein